LRERVTSKGGTTAAALDAFDAGQTAAAIRAGVLAADARGRELGEILGQN
jgi:pyrroline-5-carboxylate reductase